MRILFVYDAVYAVGGIQTLLVRLGRALVAQGHEVSLLTRPRMYPDDYTSEILDSLPPEMSVYVAEHRYTMRAAPSSARSAGVPQGCVVVCCSLQALLLTVVLQDVLRPAALVIGVFSPREYCWQRGRRGVDGKLSRRILEQVPSQNIFFTTDGMAAQTGACVERSFSGSPVLPLAVDVAVDAESVTAGRPAQPARLVTITRTTPYYPIHWQLLEVVQQLTNRGHDVELHSYGAGESLEELRTAAAERGLDNRVVFHGALDYADMDDALRGCFAYVGLGTSLLEAAARGIPALVAIDCSPTATTYGFLHEVSGNDLGGYVPGLPEQPIADRLAWLLDGGEQRFLEVAEACRKRAMGFSMAAFTPKLLDALKQAQPFKARIGPLARAAGRLDSLLWRALPRLGVRDTRADRYAMLVRQ